MKIVTWNCNLNFSKKYERIEPVDADICIIQECERVKQDYFPNRKFLWTGRIDNKGLGILLKNGHASIDSSHNPDLVYFLPVRSDDFKVLGLWDTTKGQKSSVTVLVVKPFERLSTTSDGCQMQIFHVFLVGTSTTRLFGIDQTKAITSLI